MTMSIQEIEKLIQGSKQVLVGIGEEFSLEKTDFLDSQIYQVYLEKKKTELQQDEVEWLLEPIKNRYFIDKVLNSENKSIRAYKRLLELLKDKDYYIVSLNTDDILEKIGFKADRIVQPCGSVSYYQCSNNCNNEVVDSKEIDERILRDICAKGVQLGEIERPVCAKCGSKLVYNRVQNAPYCESGYLNKWKEYMEWTSRTLNKNLCILELGVNFKYPTVIRWPFEKIGFLNNKARFIRVNEKFSQVDSELASKAVTIGENAVDFLLND